MTALSDDDEFGCLPIGDAGNTSSYGATADERMNPFSDSPHDERNRHPDRRRSRTAWRSLPLAPAAAARPAALDLFQRVCSFPVMLASLLVGRRLATDAFSTSIQICGGMSRSARRFSQLTIGRPRISIPSPSRDNRGWPTNGWGTLCWQRAYRLEGLRGLEVLIFCWGVP